MTKQKTQRPDKAAEKAKQPKPSKPKKEKQRDKEPPFDPPSWAQDPGVVVTEASEDGFLEDEEADTDGSEPAEPFHSGYVAVVGRPNVGKSTFLNQIIGQKIAATTHKPQTTRKNLLGVVHLPGAQVLLLDTPGYHKAKGPLNRYMVEQSRSAIRDADVIALMVEVRPDGKLTPGNEALITELVKAKKPVVLLLNKIDQLKDKTLLLPLLQTYQTALGDTLEAAVPISAQNKNGLDRALESIAEALPEGPAFFAEDQITDQSERQIIAEFIREKTILETHQELPYATAVTIEAFEDDRPKLVRIEATLHVERPSQKAIVIGKGGTKLREIGARARKDIEYFLESKVFLGLHVKVSERWSESNTGLAEMGYGGDAGGQNFELDPDELETVDLETFEESESEGEDE